MENKAKFLIETNGDDITLQVHGDSDMLIASIASTLVSEKGEEIFELLTAAMLLASSKKKKNEEERKKK